MEFFIISVYDNDRCREKYVKINENIKDNKLTDYESTDNIFNALHLENEFIAEQLKNLLTNHNELITLKTDDELIFSVKKLKIVVE